MIYRWLFPVVWGSFAAYWLVAAASARKIKIREPRAVRIIYLGLGGLAGALLVSHDSRFGLPDWQLWPRNRTTFFLGAAMLLAGLGFAVWARIHLGQFWSASVALKEEHQLIRSGPYSRVRHPIYTGILTGLTGTAVALGETKGLVALAIAGGICLWKSRREERLLIRTFGDRYLRYVEEVPALVPCLRW